MKASIQQICLIWIRGATIVCQTRSLWVFWMLHLTPAWASRFFSFFIFVLYRLLQWRFSHKVLFSIKKEGVKPSTLRDNEVVPKHFKTRCANVQFTVQTIWITTAFTSCDFSMSTKQRQQSNMALLSPCIVWHKDKTQCTNVSKTRNNISQMFPTRWAKRFNAWLAILF